MATEEGTFLITLNYNGEEVQVEVQGLETATRLINDQQAAFDCLNKIDPHRFPIPSTSREVLTNSSSMIENVSSNDLHINIEKLWSHDAIISLINLVKNYDTELDRGIKKYVWKKIAQQLSEIFKKTYTETQVNTKWKGLVKTYKEITNHNSTSGKNRKQWEYYDKIHEILYTKPEINPVATCSSTNGLKVRSLNGTESTSPRSVEDTSFSHSETPKHNNYESTFSRKRKEREAGIDRRHKEKMQRLDTLQNSLNDLINILKKDREKDN